MADPQEAPAGGSVTTSTMAAAGTAGTVAVLTYLTHPIWPPPVEIIAIVGGMMTPILHLLGRAIYNRLVKVASDIDPTDDVPVELKP